MAETTAIEWCDSTFNPWIGCTRVSPACDDCYAARSTPARTLGIAWGPGQPRRRTSGNTWAMPKRWQRQAAKFFAEHGRRRRVFCASLADVFDNEVPGLWRQHLMSLVADTPDLDWLFLTKRIGNAARMLSDASMHDGRLLTADDQYRPPENLWIGATVVSQGEVDRDVSKLLAVPAHVRFLSIEPMLGPVSLRWLAAWPDRADGRHAEHPSGNTDHLDGLRRLDWVICGGESGPQARPISPDWARSLRDQCAAAGVPFLFKQWGEWLPMLGQAEGVTVRPEKATTPDGWVMGWAGKKAAGRHLDDRTHDGFPANLNPQIQSLKP